MHRQHLRKEFRFEMTSESCDTVHLTSTSSKLSSSSSSLWSSSSSSSSWTNMIKVSKILGLQEHFTIKWTRSVMVVVIIMSVYLTDNHAKREHVHLLVILAAVQHLRCHPVRVADDCFTLVTTKHPALAFYLHEGSAIADCDRPRQTKVSHDHRVILDTEYQRDVRPIIYSRNWNESKWISDPWFHTGYSNRSWLLCHIMTLGKLFTEQASKTSLDGPQ